LKPISFSESSNETLYLNMNACQRLAAAVILQAVKEATDTDPDYSLPARRWLASDGLIWMRLLGMKTSGLRIWLQQGCPPRDLLQASEPEDAYIELMHWCEIIIAGHKKPRRFPN